MSSQLPTNRASSADQPSTSVAEVWSSQESQHQLEDEALLAAWALVLRSYSRASVVSFGLVDGAQADIGPWHPLPAVQVLQARWPTASTGASDGILPELSLSPDTLLQEPNTAVVLSDTAAGSPLRTRLDALVLVFRTDDALQVSLQASGPAIPEAFCLAVAQTFRSILVAMAQHDHVFLSTFTLSDADRVQLRSMASILPPAVEGRLHDQFQKSAALSPALCAVQAWDGELSYAELDRVSTVAAVRLLDTGLQPGQAVLFSLEKSVWASVAVLAILKAGGAFVPVDVSCPDERIRDIAEQVDARAAVVDEGRRVAFGGLLQHVVALGGPVREHLFAGTGGGPASSRLPLVRPTDPAFVLFTSGSTGRPKGIVHEHGAVCAQVRVQGEHLGYQAARVLQFSAHRWDVFVIDVFTVWAFGGCVCVPSESGRRFGLERAINDFGADFAMLTPSVAGLIEPAAVPTLKTLVIGGEPLTCDVIEKWRSAAGRVRLVQMYGPAEAGICISGDAAFRGDRPQTLGRPLAHSVCVLVDPGDPLRLVPIGAVGELVVGGPGIAREYANNEEKTRSSFIERPPWARDLHLPVDRFYRTGDLLRYALDRLDGSLEFVGRADFQIKHHGQRIEPGEIEQVLSSREPSVQAVMVTAPKAGVFSNQLVAVVQETEGAAHRGDERVECSFAEIPTLSLPDIKARLSGALPEYMIPTALAVVDQMPYTISMKLDRRRVEAWLSSLTAHPRSGAHSSLAPGEATAHQLSRIYAELASEDTEQRAALEGKDFGLESGGIDSVRIISLSTQIQRLYGVKVPPDMLMSSSTTIRDIAAYVNDEPRAPEPSACCDMQSEILGLYETLPRHVGLRRHGSARRKVLLTGATGFLGIEILRQLLQHELVYVCVLVRADSRTQAEERIEAKASAAGWWCPSYLRRMEYWLGDLAKPDLGLSASQMKALRGETDEAHAIHSVVHNGARVNYQLDYTSLKPVNVLSTVRLLQCAMGDGGTSMSSFVFVSGGRAGPCSEESLVSNGPSFSGYTKSKLVSELLVRKLSRRLLGGGGPRLRVVRPGYIMGGAQDGRANPSDHLWRFIAACVRMGAYSRDETTRWLYIADTARVASDVVAGALREDQEPVTSVEDGMYLETVWTILERQFGFRLEGVSQRRWLRRLRQTVDEEQEDHVLFPLMHLFDQHETVIGEDVGPGYRVRPEVKAAFASNVRHLIDIGFLPATSRQCP
ncbi:hypothetical protein CDD83_3719 [Cordyceps sp. RAO-2017]|nr:hypothetical protein CDD83_3719 [Cordyceps sp. RAO-2017]